MLENINALRLLYWRPTAGMSLLLDRGRMGAAAVLALITSAILLAGMRAAISEQGLRFAYAKNYGAPGMARTEAPAPVEQLLATVYTETSFYTPLLLIAVMVVPALIAGGIWIDGLGSFGRIFQRDYGALFTCSLMAWVAASLPFSLLISAVGRAAGPAAVLGLLAATVAGFGLLLVFTVRVVLGSEAARAILIALGGIAGFAAGLWIAWNAHFNFGFLLSPFLLYFLYMAYQQSGSDLLQLGAGMRGRQSFKRYLEACTLNPADADAQYQLGLIYQQRRQFDEARARFAEAVRINPSETDAHFQLGRIARQQGRLADALSHFQTVVDQDPKHSSHEIWREVGALHLAAGRADVALAELQTYVERREFDPEGWFYLGQTQEQLKDRESAARAYRAAIHAVETAPPFRRDPLHRWSRAAQRALKKVA